MPRPRSRTRQARPSLPRKAILLILPLALLGACLTLFLSQLVLQSVYQDRVTSYGTAVLSRAVDVAVQSGATLLEVRTLPDPVCSDADLKELRFRVFDDDYLFDIGRVQENRLLCTAYRGRLPSPLPLPPPHRRQKSNVLLWANVRDVTDPRLTVDMAGDDQAIVFTAPAAFKDFTVPPDDRYGALVLTSDGSYLYRSFGETRGLQAQFLSPPDWTGPLNDRPTFRKCTPQPDICVLAAISDVNILHQPFLAVAGLGGLGAIAAGSIGAVIAQRRATPLSLAEQVRRSVADGHLTMAYQPLVRIRDHQLVGVEALARLTDLQGAPLSPELFIATAEAGGFIGTLTRRVIDTTLTELKGRLTGPDAFYVSINLSASDVVDLALFDHIEARTRALGIPPERIVFEITERSTVDHGQLATAISRFRLRGYRFYIDDFGTGYSSLAYLAELPISGIKIDRMFTRAIGKEAVSSTLVNEICSLADQLDVSLIVEGVEEEEQAAYIRRLAPEAIGQGWLFGRPGPADRIGRVA